MDDGEGRQVFERVGGAMREKQDGSSIQRLGRGGRKASNLMGMRLDGG